MNNRSKFFAIMSNLLIIIPIVMISVNSSIMSVDAANNC